MNKPRLLDVFCGEGGCSMGYRLAGFDCITGVDIKPMARYPFDFYQYDALSFLQEYGHEFDFIHASPPCQNHSVMKQITKKEFIPQTRAILQSLGVPYVIENVIGAPLIDPVLLQGNMFEGLLVKRERIFECSFQFVAPAVPTENLGIPRATKGANKQNGFVSIVGTGGLGDGLGVDYARKAMNTRAAISQAVPPQYTQYIGAAWLEQNGYSCQYPKMKVLKQARLF
jgi:DNA (cytosine-5)-methyltransferase 1